VAVTLKDIAEKVGVTQQTVSLVLNSNKSRVPISEKTRGKVLKAARELDYLPNFQAQTLRNKKSYFLGVLFPQGIQISENFYLNRLQYGIGLAVEDSNYEMVILSNVEDKDKTINLVRMNRLDGLVFIVYGAQIHPFVNEYAPVLKEARVPFVVVHTTSRIPMPFNNVGYDCFKAGYQVTEHLVNLGHKDIGLIYLNYETAWPIREGREGFLKALTDHNLEPDSNMQFGGTEIAIGYKAVKNIPKGKMPTAFVCCDDYRAMNTIKGLKELRIRVPQDCVVVSASHTITRRHADQYALERDLTTVKQPIIEKGKVAARMLMDILEKNGNGGEPQRIILGPELVIRGSSGDKI
jgi:DNA-binding LacI/PurR family transcriptional regulator